MGFGKKLKQLLDEKSVSVADLSRKTGIPRTTLYSIISRDSTPKPGDVLAISNALNIDISEFEMNETVYINNLYSAIYKQVSDFFDKELAKYQNNGSKNNNKLSGLQLFAEPSISYNAPLDVSDLTNDEIEQVKQYIEFLKSQRNKNVHSTTD